jgi:hypothetical protein
MIQNRMSFHPLLVPVFAGMMALVHPYGHAAEANDKPIGAEDIRVLVREFMANRGLASPQDRDIWPLDDRISLSPCEHKPEILARSARSNSYIIHCNGPVAWDYTIRIEHSGLANAPVAQPNATHPSCHAKFGQTPTPCWWTATYPPQYPQAIASHHGKGSEKFEFSPSSEC